MSEISVDPFLAVGIAVFIFLLFIVNVYTFVYWAHPDDRNESLAVRILIIAGLQLSGMSVLFLPIDVANNGGDPSCSTVKGSSASSSVYCGGLDMTYCWEILFSVICFVVVGVIPYASFYLEAGNDVGDIDMIPKSTLAKIFIALKSSIMLVCTYFLIQIILYFTYNSTEIPVSTFTTHLSKLPSTTYDFTDDAPIVNEVISMQLPLSQFNEYSSKTTTYLTFPVNFAVYIMAFFGWLGWWPFAVFVGVGLVAVPFELIYAYRHRPRPLSADELLICTTDLQDRTNELLEISTIMKRERKAFKDSRPGFSEARRRMLQDRIEVNKLHAMVYILERDTAELRNCKDSTKGVMPLIPYVKLLVGLFFALLTALWFCQICIYMLPQQPPSSFLNAYFISFDAWFPMFGNISYALFSLYLLLCTVVGCFKFGVNLFFIKIHPMKVGETYLTSFLFNVGVILLCTIPVVQFCNQAFADYTHYSSAYLLLGVQVDYLNFFEYFYATRFFVYIIIIAGGIMLLILFRRPRDQAGSTEEFRKQLSERAAGDSVDIPVADEENPMKGKGKGKGKGVGSKAGKKGKDKERPAEVVDKAAKSPKGGKSASKTKGGGGVGKGSAKKGGVGVSKSKGKKG
jgi:LMBR1 domain-containing protein 1